MPAPTIYYIRHGETDWNAEGRLQGTLDIPLNERGRRQAASAGMILADLLRRDGHDAAHIPFVASPLGRACMTMELVRISLKLPPDDYAIDPRLREIGYGQWESLTLAEARAADPELFARRVAAKWTVAAPGGERYLDVETRMRAWYAELTEDTVAVAHGGTARALMVVLGIETPESAADLYVEQGTVYVFKGAALTRYS
jgi:probable phosphoglycerate mutase